MKSQTKQNEPAAARPEESFQEVVHSANAVHPLIVLADGQHRAMLAVSPAMQGRVLTSTADGWDGRSFGWVNLPLIESRKKQEHFNAYGGEDRIWIGPEGGQFSVFFAAGAPFDLAHWYTPAPLDIEPFQVTRQSDSAVGFERSFTLQNYSGTRFNVKLDREVRLLSTQEIEQHLHVPSLRGVSSVGFESINKLTNDGKEPWIKKTGLLSLWVLGQFEASPESDIVIPVKAGSVSEKGEPVNTDYFAEIPSTRIRVINNVVFFKADAQFRSKIGFRPQRASGVLGSYDARNHVLTIIQYPPPEAGEEYVNSAWKIQEHPYQGDVANSYNDGPQSPGGVQLGHFYELESSSPAAALSAGQSIEHVQRTIHLQGDPKELDAIARSVLGVGVKEIENALPR
jgi:hypothetical protein